MLNAIISEQIYHAVACTVYFTLIEFTRISIYKVELLQYLFMMCTQTYLPVLKDEL